MTMSSNIIKTTGAVSENYEWNPAAVSHAHGDDHDFNSKRVTSRCLAVILKAKADGDRENVNSNRNGEEIFDDFIMRNKTCYWNPALVESMNNLQYQGFMHPNTLLVGGDALSLENLRTAWGRRVLTAPANFVIDKIGDVNPIQMEVIPQTNFIPLPEALCLVIMELNSAQLIATLDMIKERLQKYYGGDAHLPMDQLIYDTLGKLIRERKAFHTGSGYFVVTPDTYRLRSDDLTNTYTTQVSYHPMYVPVVPPNPRVPMKPMPCQANVVAAQPSSIYEQLPPLPRRHSTRAHKNSVRSHGYSDGGGRDKMSTLPRNFCEMRGQVHSDGSTRMTSQYRHPTDGRSHQPVYSDGSCKPEMDNRGYNQIYSDGSSRPMSMMDPRNIHPVYSDGSCKPDGRNHQPIYSDGSCKPDIRNHQPVYSDGSCKPLSSRHSGETRHPGEVRHSAEGRSHGKMGSSDGGRETKNVVATKNPPAPPKSDEPKEVPEKAKKGDSKKAKPKKAKGTRLSIFSRLFNRAKKKNKPAVQNTSTKAVEYATFSGQFPPPEWAWYKQQVEKQQRVEDWITNVQSVPKTQSWHQLQAQTILESAKEIRESRVVNSRMDPPSRQHSIVKPDVHTRRKSRTRSRHRQHPQPLHQITENKTPDTTIYASIHPTQKPEMTFATPSTIPPGDSYIVPSSVNVRLYPRHSSPIPVDDSSGQEDNVAPLRVINNDLAGNVHQQSSFARRAHRARRRQLRYSGTFVSVNTADMSHEYIGHQQSRTERLLSRSQDSGVNCVGLVGPNVSYATADNSPPSAGHVNSVKTSPTGSAVTDSKTDDIVPPRITDGLIRKFADIPEESPQKLNVSRASPDPTESEHSCDTVINNPKKPAVVPVSKPEKPIENEPSDSGFLSHNQHTSHDSKQLSQTSESQPNCESKSNKIDHSGVPLTKHDDAIMSDIKNFQNVWKNAEKRLSKETHLNNDHNFHSLDSLLVKEVPLNNQRPINKDSSNNSEHSISNVDMSKENMDDKLLIASRKFNMSGEFQVVGVF